MERDSKSQVIAVRQHSQLPWQRSSAAIPKSPRWEAKTAMGRRSQQQEYIPSQKYSKEEERQSTLRGEKQAGEDETEEIHLY